MTISMVKITGVALEERQVDIAAVARPLAMGSCPNGKGFRCSAVSILTQSFSGFTP